MRNTTVFSSKAFLLSLMAFISILCFSSCSGYVEGQGYFSGTIIVDPNITEKGKEISIEIHTTRFSSTSMNGKNSLKCISYFIDGKHIGDVSGKKHEENFKITYKVNDLEVGEHVVTAHCVSNYKEFVYIEDIEEGKFLVK